MQPQTNPGTQEWGNSEEFWETWVINLSAGRKLRKKGKLWDWMITMWVYQYYVYNSNLCFNIKKSWLFSMSPSVNLPSAAPGRGWNCRTLTPLWPLLLCESWTRLMTCVSIKFPNRQNLSCHYYHCAYVIMWENTEKMCNTAYKGGYAYL